MDRHYLPGFLVAQLALALFVTIGPAPFDRMVLMFWCIWGLKMAQESR